MYRKVQKFMKANTYFMTRQWDFENTVMKTVYDKYIYITLNTKILIL